MKEKILSLPSPFGGNLEIYKNIWGKSTEPLSIVSGLQGDHLNGLFLNSHLTQFLDSVVEGIDPNYNLITTPIIMVFNPLTTKSNESNPLAST